MRVIATVREIQQFNGPEAATGILSANYSNALNTTIEIAPRPVPAMWLWKREDEHRYRAAVLRQSKTSGMPAVSWNALQSPTCKSTWDCEITNRPSCSGFPMVPGRGLPDGELEYL